MFRKAGTRCVLQRETSGLAVTARPITHTERPVTNSNSTNTSTNTSEQSEQPSSGQTAAEQRAAIAAQQSAAVKAGKRLADGIESAGRRSLTDSAVRHARLGEIVNSTSLAVRAFAVSAEHGDRDAFKASGLQQPARLTTYRRASVIAASVANDVELFSVEGAELPTAADDAPTAVRDAVAKLREAVQQLHAGADDADTLVRDAVVGYRVASYCAAVTADTRRGASPSIGQFETYCAAGFDYAQPAPRKAGKQSARFAPVKLAAAIVKREALSASQARALAAQLVKLAEQAEQAEQSEQPAEQPAA